MTLPDGPRAGQTAKATLLPFTLDGQRPGVYRSPPRLGESTVALLTELGIDPAAQDALRQARVVG
jgi:crotonobetainyl-CoA:carnitine CoA-transferase CaiB-like acyl-CoA transferase